MVPSNHFYILSGQIFKSCPVFKIKRGRLLSFYRFSYVTYNLKKTHLVTECGGQLDNHRHDNDHHGNQARGQPDGPVYLSGVDQLVTFAHVFRFVCQCKYVLICGLLICFECENIFVSFITSFE